MGLRLRDLVGTSDNPRVDDAVDRLTLISDNEFVPWEDISDDEDDPSCDDDELYNDFEECEDYDDCDDEAVLVGCTDYADSSDCPGCVGCMGG